MYWNGAVFIYIQHKIRQEVIVPYPHYLQHTDGNHCRLEHGEHHPEESTQGAAAVYGRSLFYFQRQRLYKSRKHEHRQARAEAEIHYGDCPRGIQLQRIRRLCQREHHHLEGHNHGEYAEVVHYPAEQAAHPCDIPCGHRGAYKYQHRGYDGNKQAVQGGFHEGIVAKCHAGLIVVQPYEGLGAWQGKGLHIHI